MSAYLSFRGARVGVRTWNPDTGTEILTGFRVQRFRAVPE